MDFRLNQMNFFPDGLISKMALCRLHAGLKGIFYHSRIKGYYLLVPLRVLEKRKST